jgi:hypothetical protein
MRTCGLILLLSAPLLSACGERLTASSAPGLTEQSVAELQQALAEVAPRAGELPERTFAVPHLQLTQGGPVVLADSLVAAISRLDSVSIGSVQLMRDGGSLYQGRSWELAAGAGGGPDDERFDGAAFGHMHHHSSNSLHVFLPRRLARGAMAQGGWGEIHPFNAMNGLGTDTVDYVMLWGARDEAELEVLWLFVQAAYAHARGRWPLADD